MVILLVVLIVLVWIPVGLVVTQWAAAILRRWEMGYGPGDVGAFVVCWPMTLLGIVGYYVGRGMIAVFDVIGGWLCKLFHIETD